MKEECLICKAPLEYLENDELMECAICHKKESSKTRCVHGHYVCNDCHTAGLDTIIGLCLAETSRNPVEIIERMMEQPEVICRYSSKNNQCIGRRCPFSPANH